MEKEVSDGRNNKVNFIIIIGLILLQIFISWCSYMLWYPSKTLCFSDSFETGISAWEAVDAVWIQQEAAENGIVKLTRDKYAAPYIMRHIPLNDSPTESFVWHLRFKISSFTNDALTIASLIFPSSQATLVVSRQCQIGLASELFAPPVYTNNLLPPIEKNKWEDIYVLFNEDENLIKVYKSYSMLLSVPYKPNITPVLELWLGAIWLNGAGNYGMPLNIEYESTSMGSKGLIPKSPLIAYTLNTYSELWDALWNTKSFNLTFQ